MTAKAERLKRYANEIACSECGKLVLKITDEGAKLQPGCRWHEGETQDEFGCPENHTIVVDHD